ncbi:pyridoxamine 5'-phosphate oxidase family protein [uncultured Anaerococcus sp.]|uniref:pyridoxamine 5'-phosphate oxidase family protein n=1 Tax=uncultured Anaerococcus sp. TaxID=293428 RepID=UPI00288AE377|nr:pyridoxamine 5'-phosphate oxidase family protein [uncultured Anaerococcus sp.]
MFRKIRKVKNEICLEKIKEILEKSPRGVLALNGEDDYPYAFPLNFVYDEENQSIYFHGTKTGYKIDCIEKNPKACFTVILEDGLADDGWSKITSSVVAYGLVEEITDRDFARDAMINLAKKYYPNVDLVHENMEAGFKNTKMLAFHISYMTGKKVNER